MTGLPAGAMVRNRIKIEAKRLVAYTSSTVTDSGYAYGQRWTTDHIAIVTCKIGLSPLLEPEEYAQAGYHNG